MLLNFFVFLIKSHVIFLAYIDTKIKLYLTNGKGFVKKFNCYKPMKCKIKRFKQLFQISNCAVIKALKLTAHSKNFNSARTIPLFLGKCTGTGVQF
jgi:hypothetical protein